MLGLALSKVIKSVLFAPVPVACAFVVGAFVRFDLAFATYFKNVNAIFDIRADIPEEWLRREFQRYLSDEDKKLVEALGGWDKLMETLKKRLEEQRERHQGGSKWIGTGGTSPFGAYGYNPEGIRIGQDGGGSRSAVKVWDERTFRNLDGDVELNTRNIKVALRRLRRFAREGVADELDGRRHHRRYRAQRRLAGSEDAAGAAQSREGPAVPQRRRLDGSLRARPARNCSRQPRASSGHLEHFYFHNCVYDYVWHDNARRRNERMATLENCCAPTDPIGR